MQPPYQVFCFGGRLSVPSILTAENPVDGVYHDLVYYMLPLRNLNNLFENNPFHVNIFVGKYFPNIFLIREKNIAFIFVYFFNVWLNRKPLDSCICLCIQPVINTILVLVEVQYMKKIQPH